MQLTALNGLGYSFLLNNPGPGGRSFDTRMAMSADHESASSAPAETTESRVASQLKVVTCSSTSCAKKRKDLGQDEYATFSEFYMRAKDIFPTMTVEESPCLGCCKAAPCVAVEHEEYEGTVSLEGMTETEFSDRVFENIFFSDDVDRVWESIENAVQVLTAQEEEDENEGPASSQGAEV